MSIRTRLFVFTGLGFAVCVTPSCKARKTANQEASDKATTVKEIPLHTTESYFGGSKTAENRMIEVLMDETRATVEKNHTGSTIAKRGAHPKQHGCVTATFTLLDSRPVETKVGIFKDHAPYPAWIRFSNAFPAPDASDANPDARGMAIKIIGNNDPKLLPDHENSNAVDYPLVSGPIFPVRDMQEYSDLQADAGKFFANNPRATGLSAKIVSQVILNPLKANYWSMGAYLLGDRAVKYKTSTVKCPDAPFFDFNQALGHNFLRDTMALQLFKSPRPAPACFEFSVQFQDNSQGTMPVEDPSVEWRAEQTLLTRAQQVFGNETPISPFIPIAKIRIEPQDFTKNDDFCERLSFNPWRTLEEQRPLGNLMRARRMVYRASLDTRTSLNHAKPVSDQLTGTSRDVSANQ